MLVQLEPGTFGVDPSRGTPVLVLKETGGQRTLMIPVGPFEASAIAISSLGVAVEQPLAIDLVKQVMGALGGALERLVLMPGGEENSLAGRLQVSGPNGPLLISCSPSYGIILALRCGAPMFAFERVFTQATATGEPTPSQMLRRSIASLDTVDFGRYHLE